MRLGGRGADVQVRPVIGRVYRFAGRHWIVRARGEPFDRGPRRNVLLEAVWPFHFGWGDHWFQCVDGRWWRPDAPVGEQGELVVRPFRGLRRA